MATVVLGTTSKFLPPAKNKHHLGLLRSHPALIASLRHLRPPRHCPGTAPRRPAAAQPLSGPSAPAPLDSPPPPAPRQLQACAQAGQWTPRRPGVLHRPSLAGPLPKRPQARETWKPLAPRSPPRPLQGRPLRRTAAAPTTPAGALRHSPTHPHASPRCCTPCPRPPCSTHLPSCSRWLRAPSRPPCTSTRPAPTRCPAVRHRLCPTTARPAHPPAPHPAGAAPGRGLAAQPPAGPGRCPRRCPPPAARRRRCRRPAWRQNPPSAQEDGQRRAVAQEPHGAPQRGRDGLGGGRGRGRGRGVED